MSVNNKFQMQLENETDVDLKFWWFTHGATDTTKTSVSGKALLAGATTALFSIFVSSDENDHFAIFFIDADNTLYGTPNTEYNLPSGAPQGTVFKATLAPSPIGDCYEVTIDPNDGESGPIKLPLLAVSGTPVEAGRRK